MVDLSVVIPTYNRHAVLVECLAALDRQDLDRSRYEIIVVDDGSTDGTRATLAARAGIEFVAQERNAGPAAARNRGVQAARGTYILFLGDDTIASPSLLAQHLAAHDEAPGEHIAVLGHARWAPRHEVTPLMRYLTEGASVYRQFAYDRIVDPDDVPGGHFYTCNLSISRAFLLRHGLFDEDFRYAYGEDTELAYRLERHGLRIVYRPALVVDHVHPTPYASARRRAAVAGTVDVMMADKYPERFRTDFLSTSRKTRVAIPLKRVATTMIVDPILDLADRRRWDHPRLAHVYGATLQRHQLWGMLAELRRRDQPNGRQAER
jgi:glycosyltransferase involved in cell wall biosynthesis